MGLTVSQLGLFLATGILLAAVVSFVFFNASQRTNELRSFATEFSMLLQDMEARCFENTTRFRFPQQTYPYTLRLSSEYLVVSAQDFWGRECHVTERFLIKPWIRGVYENWTTGDELHMYLNTTYGHYGTQNDTIPLQNFSLFLQQYNASADFYASHPFAITSQDPVCVENVIIYCQNELKYDFILVYQFV